MADIKEKIEMELKPYEAICETTLDELKDMINGSGKVEAHEILSVAKTLGEIIDVKKDIVEMCYKKQIMEAMENSEYGEDYDEHGEIAERRYYRGQPRSKTSGRYMSRGDGRRSYVPEMYMNYPDEYYRDLDRTDGRMYYSGVNKTTGGNDDNYARGYTDGQSEGYQRGYREGSRTGMTGGRYETARRGYEETKAHKTGNQAEDNQREMKSLEQMLNAFESELSELLPKMSPSEKNLAKTKIVSWQNKVQ